MKECLMMSPINAIPIKEKLMYPTLKFFSIISFSYKEYIINFI